MRGARTLIRILGVALLAAIGTAWTGTLAVGQENTAKCGAFYRVKPGDTLRAITVRAYSHDRYDVVFNANRDILPSAARIETGQLIYLPCANNGPQTRLSALSTANITPTPQDQRGSRAAGNAPAPQVEVATSRSADSVPKRTVRARKPLETGIATTPVATGQAVAVVTPRNQQTRSAIDASPQPVRMLSSEGFEPMAGSKLPSGGLVGALIEGAFRQVQPGIRLEPAIVNDRKAHLEVLLPLDVFAMSYPWPAPDCSGSVGHHSREFCEKFHASLPIFQVELRAFARKGSAPAGISATDAMQSLAICRPHDFPPYDLESLKMRRVLVAEDVSACMGLLKQGKADIVSVPTLMMKGHELEGEIVEIEALRSQVPVHAIFLRDSRDASRLREQLNNGLRKLQASGDWFSTVSSYLSDYNSGRLARQ